MSRQDQSRWDEKWSEIEAEAFDPHPLLRHYSRLLSGGLALDIACGRGQNAIWLAGRGYRILGLDISPVALSHARTAATVQNLVDRTLFCLVDLDDYALPTATFDLICVFRFLDRRLYSGIKSALRPGGLLFYSTRHVGALDHNPQARHAFLLRRGELAAEFADWSILHDAEDMQNAGLVAQKPGPTG